MRIGRDYVKEWDGTGWTLRHEPTGLRAYLGNTQPSDEKVQESFRTLQARVSDVERSNDKR